MNWCRGAYKYFKFYYAITNTTIPFSWPPWKYYYNIYIIIKCTRKFYSYVVSIFALRTECVGVDGRLMGRLSSGWVEFRRRYLNRGRLLSFWPRLLVKISTDLAYFSIGVQCAIVFGVSRWLELQPRRSPGPETPQDDTDHAAAPGV